MHASYEVCEIFDYYRPSLKDGYSYLSCRKKFACMCTIVDDSFELVGTYTSPSRLHDMESVKLYIQSMLKSEPDNLERIKWIKQTWEKVEHTIDDQLPENAK